MIVFSATWPSGSVMQDTVTKLRAQVEDLRPAFVEILADFKASERALFASGGAEVGGWQPDAASFRRRGVKPVTAAGRTAYAEWKAKHYPGSTILEKTGRLARAAAGDEELAVFMQPLFLSAQITTRYAAFVAARWHIAPLTPARQRRWIQIVNDYLVHAGERAGRELVPA